MGEYINKIIHADCMDIMKGIPDNYIDLAIVDPPYGINADNKNSDDSLKSSNSACKSKDYGNQIWDNYIPPKEYFNELLRVSKNQIIWGINYYPYDFSGGRIYWKKNVTMPTYSDGELAYCSLINSVREFEFTWHGMIQGDMKNKEIRIHPTQKPIKLYQWILKNYAKKGDLILDTHSGSGSCAIACMLEGFDFIAIEKDEQYWEDSVKRLEMEKGKLEGIIYDKKMNPVNKKPRLWPKGYGYNQK